MTETITFIVVSWNTRDMVLDCLASIFAGGDECRSRVILVDNGSRDDTCAAVSQDFPQVEIIANERNLGFARAVNLALQQVATPYAVLFNSDARLEPSALDTLIDYMDCHPDIAVIGGQLLHEDGRRQNSYDSSPDLLTELGNKSLLRLLWPARYPGKRQEVAAPIDVDIVIGACFLVRMGAAKQVGLLDERFFFYMEESDWCLRFRRAGWRVVHHPQAHITHLQGRSAHLVRSGSRIEFYRSRYLYFHKHFGLLTTAALKVGLLARLLVNLAGQALAGIVSSKARIIARVQWDIFKWHLAGCPDGPGLPRD